MKTPFTFFSGGRAALWFALLWIFGATAVFATADLRPFDAKSLAEIRQAHAGRPFVLAFWSIHCAPCKEEMSLLSEFKRRYPQVSIVLVATDPPSEKPTVIRYLAGQKPGPLETWSFADEFAERVRFAVDRKWRGELPRTYFYNAEHQPTAQTGSLDPAWVESWMKQETAPKPKSDPKSGHAPVAG